MSSRNYVFTINNYTEQDAALVLSEHMKYLVYGKEVAPTTGTPHLQGFVCFKEAKSPAAVRSHISFRAVVQMKSDRSTFKQASDYCKKDGDFYEGGTLPADKSAQKRKLQDDYQRAWELAKAGDIEDVEPSLRLRHYSTLKLIQKDYMVEPEELPDVCGIWIRGVPNVGKSHLVRATYPNHYDKGIHKWWDGFRPSKHFVVHLEDLSLKHDFMGFFLKRWADKYPFNAEAKGTAMMIRPKFIVVTSNYTIEEIFGEDPVQVEAINRRFKVYHYTNRAFPPILPILPVVEVAVTPTVDVINLTDV